MTMINGFLRILGPERGRMYSFLAWAVGYGLLHGLSMTLLVPISLALFDGDFGGAWRWLLVLAVVVLLSAVAHYVQAAQSMRMALTTMRLLHHRLGDHMVTLPLGWFTRERVGQVSQIAVKGTTFVGTSSAHLVTPLVVNTTSALTVVAGLFVFDWRIGIAALAGGVVLIVATRASATLIASAEARTHAAEIEVNSRVIEFARCQPVLRAFGRTGAEFDPLTGALAEQEQVGKRALWASVAGMMLSGVGAQATGPGTTVTYAHVFTAGTVGAVTFSPSQNPTPANPACATRSHCRSPAATPPRTSTSRRPPGSSCSSSPDATSRSAPSVTRARRCAPCWTWAPRTRR